jgi:hypothetical protein
MARKKSIKTAAKTFATEADAILAFLARISPNATDADLSWVHDYAIIRLYREFESLILDALVGAINNDTTTISGTSGVKFPKHLTDEVCEYLVTGGGYFDFMLGKGTEIASGTIDGGLRWLLPASDLDEFWKRVRNGMSIVTEVGDLSEAPARETPR